MWNSWKSHFVSVCTTQTMAEQYGCLKEFLLDADSIGAYVEWMSLYFQGNDIVEGKQVPILLSSIGAWTYSLLRDLVAPDAPGTIIHWSFGGIFIAFPAKMLDDSRMVPLPYVCPSCVDESISNFMLLYRSSPSIANLEGHQKNPSKISLCVVCDMKVHSANYFLNMC